MDTVGLEAKATALRRLHVPGRPLLLVNAWDAASAVLVARAGAQAVATTSAGAANALGYADGQLLSRAQMLASVAPIAAAVDVPVTADMEAGYGDTPEDAAATARGVLEAGGVGLNLEDTSEGASGATAPDRPVRRQDLRGQGGGSRDRRAARPQRSHGRLHRRDRRTRDATRPRSRARARLPGRRCRLRLRPCCVGSGPDQRTRRRDRRARSASLPGPAHRRCSSSRSSAWRASASARAGTAQCWP